MTQQFSLGPARVWCSDRWGGVSRAPYAELNVGDHVGDRPDAVAENRDRLAATVGVAPTQFVWLNQVHGNRVLEAEAPVFPVPDADASLTTRPGLALAVLTADCAPIALACDDAIGAVHAGHRGLRAGVIEATVEAMRVRGTGPMRALLGPCVRPARYEFGRADLKALVEHFGDSVAARTDDGRPAFDIPAAVRIALARSGVDEVVDVGVCTAASPDHFSYRRDGVTGRQATVIVLP